MTKFLKKDDLNSKWFEIDATGAVVGRLATVVSKILRGKNKATFTPHMDSGDFVVVKNVDQLKFTGNKFSNKKYYRHTGHPGGIKETTPEILQSTKPGEILKMAVKQLERSVKTQHQADTHHDLIYLLTRAHEAYKNSKK